MRHADGRRNRAMGSTGRTSKRPGRSGGLALLVAAGLLVAPLEIGEHDFERQTVLRSSDLQAGDRFGFSVATSGETAVVGAVSAVGGPDDDVDSAGAAYVFERVGGTRWVQVAKLTDSKGQLVGRFGSSVAISGDTVVVGAPDHHASSFEGGRFSGAAYVFQRDHGGANKWGEVAKLTASDAQPSDYFGIGVAISGDTAVVGARDDGASDVLDFAGAVYVFERDLGGTNGWGERTKLTASDAQEGDNFGTFLAISGDSLLVGAWAEDGGLNDPLVDAGAAYIFERDQGGTDNWGELTKLTAPDAQAFDHFGSAVAISGDDAVVGARREDGPSTTGAGAAYVFGRDQGGTDNWGDVKKLTASDAQLGDEFGTSVAISGDVAIVGALFEAGGAGDPITNAGAAYLFGRGHGGADTWGELAKLAAADPRAEDHFGRSVGISGEAAVVGAHQEDGGPGDPLPEAGAAFMHDEKRFLDFFIGDRTAAFDRRGR